MIVLITLAAEGRVPTKTRTTKSLAIHRGKLLRSTATHLRKLLATFTLLYDYSYMPKLRTDHTVSLLVWLQPS